MRRGASWPAWTHTRQATGVKVPSVIEAQAPRDKMICVMNLCRIINSILIKAHQEANKTGLTARRDTESMRLQAPTSSFPC